MSVSLLSERLALANRIARESGEIIRTYFQTDRFQLEKKADHSPLTIADRETEQFLRKEIESAFPEDTILGEEFAEKEGNPDVRWILDPIDGTKSFISGVPLFGTMVGVEILGVPTIGSVYFPGLDEGIYACTGQGAWHFRGSEAPTVASVSDCDDLGEAVVVTTEVETFAKRNSIETWRELADAAYFARTWGDVYGYLLVATGRVDVMIDPVLNIWDAAAVQPIIQEAGGRFTDWAGVARIDGGEAIGCNAPLHEQVLQITGARAGKFHED